ncbi:MAG: indole-3-glycerol phosphate synthase TrpC, partial [Bacteroidota bacterium]
MNHLKAILEYKREEISEARSSISQKELQKRIADAAPAKSFRSVLCGEGLALIAEIKKASP